MTANIETLYYHMAFTFIIQLLAGLLSEYSLYRVSCNRHGDIYITRQQYLERRFKSYSMAIPIIILLTLGFSMSANESGTFEVIGTVSGCILACIVKLAFLDKIVDYFIGLDDLE